MSEIDDTLMSCEAREWAIHAPTTIVREVNGKVEVIAECSGHGRHSSVDAAYARRIAAALNACKGIPTEYLEAAHAGTEMSLAAALNAAETTHLNLEFYDWETGHHGICPDPISVEDEDHALDILRAISHAIFQPGRAMARLVDPVEHEAMTFYLCEDYVRKDSDWKPYASEVSS